MNNSHTVSLAWQPKKPSVQAVIGLFLFVALIATSALVGKWTSPTKAISKPSIDLEQCANLGTTCDSTHPGNWITGNLNSGNSTYVEGQSVPYRAVFSGLTSGKTYSVEIEWDTTKFGHHAIDYLTTYNRSETTAAPCAGVMCASGTATLAIPLDSNVSSAGVTQIGSQNFTLFGGTFPATGASVANSGDLCAGPTCVIAANPSPYSSSGMYAGDSSTRIRVYFTASGSEAVLAWGGHLATRIDWGVNKSASTIEGSPYHMKIEDFDCSTTDCNSGSMDRSLSSGAVIAPASITIIKQASLEGNTSFSFVGSPSPLTNFNLVDDGTTANKKVFSGITSFGIYTITENSLGGWIFDDVSCVGANQHKGWVRTEGSSAEIMLSEGEDVTCTFYNDIIPAPALTLTKTANVANFSGAGQLITYTYVIQNTGNVPIGPVQFSVDDDKINGGLPFACGPAASTLAVNATLQCTAVYTTVAGDVNNSVTNTAFAIAGSVTSSSKQVTVPFVATTTTTTLAPTTTTLAPAVTTTVPVSVLVTPTTTAPAGIQGGVTVLPTTGSGVGLFTILAGVLLLLGLGSFTVASNRRSRRASQGGK